MFERFTDRARRVVVLAQEEARLLNHNYIGTEHILLGILREGEGVAAQVLAGFGADYAQVREQVQWLLTNEVEQPGPRTRLVHMTVPEDLRQLEEQIAQVRQQKGSAIQAKDSDRAAALRDQERQLLVDRARREQEWMADVNVGAVIDENQRLHGEVERLQGLLRRHGIEPNGGTAQTG